MREAYFELAPLEPHLAFSTLPDIRDATEELPREEATHARVMMT